MNLGIDIGSTTAKVVVLDQDQRRVFSCYERHNARIVETVVGMLNKIPALSDEAFSVGITGSIGMGIAQNTGIRFIQEVVAASKAARLVSGKTLSCMIEINDTATTAVIINKIFFIFCLKNFY